MTVARVAAERLDGRAGAAALRDAAGTARELAAVLSRLASLHEQRATRRDPGHPLARHTGPPAPAESLHARAELLLHRLRSLEQVASVAQQAAPPAPPPAGSVETGWQSLTGAERQVVRAVTAGRTNREAANVLFLSPHTVNSHLRHVYAKLGISSRTELVRLAVCHEDPGGGLQT